MPRLRAANDVVAHERAREQAKIAWLNDRTGTVAAPPGVEPRPRPARDGSLTAHLERIRTGSSPYEPPSHAELVWLRNTITESRRLIGEYETVASALRSVINELADLLSQFQRASVVCGATLNASCPEPLQANGRVLSRLSDWAPHGATSLASSFETTIAYVFDNNLDLDALINEAERREAAK
ncbi:MAG TPA: hypothetical protein VMH32_15615 [Burkholderiales bacterium]|nr:hypothetical protein [Burkholderiales bacterium]